MADLTEIEFGRLDVRDGDVLVIKVPFVLKREQQEHLVRIVKDALSERVSQVKVMVLEAGTDIAVLRKADDEHLP